MAAIATNTSLIRTLIDFTQSSKIPTKKAGKEPSKIIENSSVFGVPTMKLYKKAKVRPNKIPTPPILATAILWNFWGDSKSESKTSNDAAFEKRIKNSVQITEEMKLITKKCIPNNTPCNIHKWTTRYYPKLAS